MIVERPLDVTNSCNTNSGHWARWPWAPSSSSGDGFQSYYKLSPVESVFLTTTTGFQGSLICSRSQVDFYQILFSIMKQTQIFEACVRTRTVLCHNNMMTHRILTHTHTALGRIRHKMGRTHSFLRLRDQRNGIPSLNIWHMAYKKLECSFTGKGLAAHVCQWQ